MAEKWAGIKTEGSEIICVVLEIDKSQRKVIQDFSIFLQNGPRSDAYAQAYARILDFLTQNQIKKVVFIPSTLSMGKIDESHLRGAELRGAIQVALVHAGASINCVKIASIKKKKGILGPLQTTKYMDDDNAWSEVVSGKLRKGSRDAAIVAIATQIEEIPEI